MNDIEVFPTVITNEEYPVVDIKGWSWETPFGDIKPLGVQMSFYREIPIIHKVETRNIVHTSIKSFHTYSRNGIIRSLRPRKNVWVFTSNWVLTSNKENSKIHYGYYNYIHCEMWCARNYDHEYEFLDFHKPLSYQ